MKNTVKLTAIIKKTCSFIVIILSLASCKAQKRVIEKIDFKTSYKFSSEIKAEMALDNSSRKYQISASDYASKGDYKNALIQWDLARGSRERNFTKTQTDSINQKYSKVKASDYIIEQAKTKKVVIINEAHHNSYHRVFTKSLLKDLYAIGYRNLGLEALSNDENLDSLQKLRKYPTQKTGYYISDPQFGNLVREAIEIGYTIFPYETKNEEANEEPREIDQAKNIQKAIEAKPDEKFLIHCGYDHALEGNHDYWIKAMAERLTEYTGINPLTINQVVYSEKSNPNFNHPLLKAIEIEESTILIDNDNNPLKYQQGKAYTDIAVFHPNTTYINNRPNWLFGNGNKNVPIMLSDIRIEFPVMVFAFKKGENLDLAVPLDITEVENKEQICNLGLKNGVYEIVISNGTDSYKFQQTVK